MKIDKIITVICIIIIFAIGIGTLVSDNKDEMFSPDENRMLEGMPEINIDSIISGEFASSFEKYMIDRIPLRSAIIHIQNTISQSLSVVTLEDTLNVVDTKIENQMENLDTEELEETIIAETASATPSPQPTPLITATVIEVFLEDYTPEPTATPDPNKFSGYKYRSIGFIDNDTNKQTNFINFETKDVLEYADTLNDYAALLPEGGNLVHIFALESQKARPAISAVSQDKDITIIDQTVEVLEYYTDNKVHILSGPIVLEEPMKNGEQVYFFTDHHWTVEGIHYVYTEAMNQIGITPLKWEDYDVTYEYPYRGSYYRKSQTNYYKENPDTLAIISFPQADTFTHYLGKTIEELPILNFEAPANDRYRIYYDGPKSIGPLGVVNTINDTGKNALVILDSYGLPFSCMLIPHYDTICVMDLRYMYISTEKYYISDIMEKYEIDDIFIVLGDLNTFGEYYSKSLEIYLHSNGS